MPASSSEACDNDPTIKTDSKDESVPVPAPVYVGLTMEQAHFNATMAEEQSAPVPMSPFW